MCAFFQIRSDRSPNLLAAPLVTVHKHKKPTAAYCSRALWEGDSALWDGESALRFVAFR